MNQSISLGGYIREKYVEFHRSKLLKSYRQDMLMIDIILTYSIADKPLTSITRNDLISFFAELQAERKITKARVNRYIARFSNIFNFAIDEGDLIRNPLRGVKKSKEYQRGRSFTEEELDVLFDECRASRNKELHPIVVLAVNTGMRRGEILKLTKANVNLRQKNILLHWSMTKTGESRTVPLNDAALSVLEEVMKGCRDGERIFKSIDFSGAFEKAMERAGIEQGRFHDLRRTFATRLIDTGSRIGIVSILLGHSNIITTERYISHRESDLRECVSKVNCK